MPNKKKKKKVAQPLRRTNPPLLGGSLDGVEELDEHHQSIFSLVRDQLQVDFSRYKITTVSRRIQRQMKCIKTNTC